MAQYANTSRPRPMPPGPARRARHETLFTVLSILCVVALLVFAGLGYEVHDGGVVDLNTVLLLDMHGYARPDMNDIAVDFTRVGNVSSIGVLGAVLAGVFVALKRFSAAAALVASLFAATGLVGAIKHVVQEPRPELFPRIVQETGTSFPSGHSTLSFCLFGFVAIWLLIEGTRKPLYWLGALACWALAACVALSRLYLGVHWPADVLAGATLGTACTCGSLAVQHWLEARRQPELDA